MAMDTLDDIARLVRECADCPLHQGRTQAVPGEGPADAELLFIGEGPGVQEDRQGRPFVGPAGGFLEELLQSIGMSRDQVYIANMVKCRPPDNRDPAPGEIAACAKYLDRQIELINPRLIVTLGRFATARFLPGESIGRARGRLRTVNGRRIYPIMHPAAGLRRQEMKDAIVEDFQKLAGLLEVLRMDIEPSSPAVEPSSPAVEPSSLAVEPSSLAVEPSSLAVEPSSLAVEPSSPAVEPSSPAVEPSSPHSASENDGNDIRDDVDKEDNAMEYAATATATPPETELDPESALSFWGAPPSAGANGPYSGAPYPDAPDADADVDPDLPPAPSYDNPPPGQQKLF